LRKIAEKLAKMGEHVGYAGDTAPWYDVRTVTGGTTSPVFGGTGLVATVTNSSSPAVSYSAANFTGSAHS
jgi:hypothetical protein